MTPRARANLRSLCVVGCDGENYGKIVIYSFPKGALVFGPSQVNALIHQDTTISELFTLWNQQGSKVDRGRMIVLPLAGAIFYIQPVYLKAAGPLKIPQLKRLIVSKGEIMTMQPNLEEAFQKLAVRFQKRTGSTGKPAPEPEASSPGRQDEAGAAPTFPDTR
jgi:uncharacterized membrane protein (UPF0182 family)